MSHASPTAAVSAKKTTRRRKPVAHEAAVQYLRPVPPGSVAGVRLSNAENDIVKAALSMLAVRLRQPGCLFDGPQSVKDYLTLSLSTKPHEVFMVLFLDSQHRLIAAEEMFRGTLTQTSVYPREVVVHALNHQAACVILAHNHPSGSGKPSAADIALTRTLKTALALVDVTVLDHMVVAGFSVTSMAELGMV